MIRRRVRDHALFEFAAATLAALALTFVAFGPGLSARFVSDDINAIVENEWVAGEFDPVGIARNFSWWGQSRPDSVGYRPAATLSFAVNRAVSGPDAYGFRVVNYVLNALCAGLLFALARGLGLGRETSAAAALLFAVLPIHSEAVIWIVGRAELGAAAGFLLAALACLHYRHIPHSRSLPLLAAAAAAIAVGMAFKENAVTVLAAPAIFFLALGSSASPGARSDLPLEGEVKSPRSSDKERPRNAAARLPGEGAASWRRDAEAFVALLAGLAGYGLLRAAASGPAIAPEPGSLLDNPLSVLDTATRLLGALAVLGRYLRLTLWPSSLSIDYSYDALAIGPGFVANADSAIAIAFLAAAVWALSCSPGRVPGRGPGRRSIVAVGLLLAAASYSIVSNTVFVLGTILGERLFYLPSAGLCLALAAIVEPAFAGTPGRRKRVAVPARAVPAKAVAAKTVPAKVAPALVGAAFVIVTVGAVAVVVAAVAVDRRRSVQWMTPLTLFEAAASAVPRSARAHMELASAYGAGGRIDDANRHFATALAIKPDYTAAAYNQGNTLAHAGRYDEAAVAYRSALAIDPRFARAWHNLALTERLRGRTDAWIEAMRSAVESSPRSSALRSELADALLTTGRNAEAISEYDTVVADNEAVAATYFNRGVARHRVGGCATALEDYRLAAKVPAAPAEAFAAAAGCLRELGRSDEAASIERAMEQAREQAGKVANRGTRR